MPTATADRVGFIGGGMIASALMGGLVKARAVPSSSAIAVSEPYTPMREKHLKNGFAATTSNAEVVQRSDTIVLAVKPDVIPAVLRECAAAVGTAKLVVSIAAGVPLRTLEGLLPPGARVVRVMPNLPCLVSEMAAGFAPGSHATRADAERVKALLGCVGRATEVPEKLMDAVTGLSGSGPAYGFVMIEALADAGVRAGLPRPTALTLAAQTMKGAAAMVLETGKHPGQLKDEVSSPGGTTIAGVEALEREGLRYAAMAGVAAATARSKELSKL